MKISTIFFFLFVFLTSWSQTKKDTLIPVAKELRASPYSFSEKKFYDSPEGSSKDGGHVIHFEFTLPLGVNPRHGEINEYTNETEPAFLLDGLGAKFGYGFHYDKWIGLSGHTGIDYRIRQKLVSVPVYGLITLSPRLTDELGLLFQFGYGKSFAIGRGDLMGTYQKYRVGILIDDGISLFLDASLNGFKLKNEVTGSLSIGIAILTFD